MTELKRLAQKAILKTVINEGTPALLGRADGELYFKDAGGNVPDVNRVWARVGVSDNPVEMVVYCSEIAKQRNLPVIVADRNGVPTVIRADSRRADVFNADGPGTVTTAPHAGTHGRFGTDPLYVSGAAFVPGMPRPAATPGLSVAIERVNYRYGGSNKSFAPATLDLSAYVPEPVKQRFVVVSLNRTTNALLVTASTPVISVPITPAVPFTISEVLAIVDTLAFEQLPLAAIRLYSGQARIIAQDIFFDLRLWAGELGTLTLDELSDVDAPSPSLSQVLMWDDGDSQWEAISLHHGHISDWHEAGTDIAATIFAGDLGDFELNFNDTTNVATPTIKPNAVSFSKMGTMLESTIIGRYLGSGTGDPIALSMTMVANMLSGELVPTDIAGLTEFIEDSVGAMVLDTSTIDFVYDDGAGTLTAAIKTGSVANSLLGNMAQATVKGRATVTGTGAPTDLTGSDLIAIIGPLGTSGVADDSITNAKLANMAEATVKGRAVGAGTGDPVDLTAAQLNAIIGSANLTMANGLYIAMDEVRARDSGGLLLRDDGGNYGIYIEDNGRVSVGDGTSPGVAVLRVGGAIRGSGGAALYLDPATNAAGGTQYGLRVLGNPANAADFVGVGIHGSPNFTNYRASLWVGNEANRPGINVGYAQTVDAPIHGAMIAGNLGVGVSGPQGKFHAHTGAGGFLAVTKTSVAGSAITLIPDGTGDVTAGYQGIFVVLTSGGGVGQPFVTGVLGHGDVTLHSTGGPSTLVLRWNANGSMELVRTAGTLTYTVAGWLVWI